MDYTNFNIIKILPGIYVADSNINNYEVLLSTLNIKYLININNIIPNDKYITLNINTNNNFAYVDSDEMINIDLNITNDFICNALQNNGNILICDVNNMVPFIILGAFCVKYLYMSYTESVQWLYIKLNIKTQLPEKILYQLFTYYTTI
jgi:hypothetical protein